jgi:hypothetical protein
MPQGMSWVVRRHYQWRHGWLTLRERTRVLILKVRKTVQHTLLRTSRSGHWQAAKIARQKVPGAIVLAIPAGPHGNKIPVISNASRCAHSGTQIAEWTGATDFGDRPAGQRGLRL